MIPSITQDQLFTVLRAFLLNVLPGGVEVFQGQDNLVAEPPTAKDFVVMTPTMRRRLETNTDTWDQSAHGNPTVIATLAPTEATVQLDIHGPGSADNAQVVLTVFRDAYACDFFAGLQAGMQPLYAGEPIQAPFVNGENQYEDRWTLNVMIQVNPQVSTPMQFADVLDVTLIEVDERYPP